MILTTPKYKAFYNNNPIYALMEVFITGGTGFVGSALVKSLLRDEETTSIIILVRNILAATNHFIKLGFKKYINNGRLILIEGDICVPNLGLTEFKIKSLLEIEEVFHLASSVSLLTDQNKKEEILTTNYIGTKNLLDMFKDSKKLRNFYYFSSAYVCGNYSGEVKENWIDRPKSFRNYYEESKWLSEELIKEYHLKYGIPFIVLRPSIISTEISDKSSELSGFTIYRYCNIIRDAFNMQKITKIATIRLHGSPNSTLNIIPLNFVIKIISEIRKGGFVNKIFNLTSDLDCHTRFILDGLEDALKFKGGFVFVKNLSFSFLSEAEKFAYIKTKPFWEYLLGDKILWSSQNSEQLRREQGLFIDNPKWIKGHIKNYFSKQKETENGIPIRN